MPDTFHLEEKWNLVHGFTVFSPWLAPRQKCHSGKTGRGKMPNSQKPGSRDQAKSREEGARDPIWSLRLSPQGSQNGFSNLLSTVLWTVLSVLSPTAHFWSDGPTTNLPACPSSLSPLKLFDILYYLTSFMVTVSKVF